MASRRVDGFPAFCPSPRPGVCSIVPMGAGLSYVDPGRIRGDEAPAAVPRPHRADPAARLLRLQRTAGNAAVVRLLRAPPGDQPPSRGGRVSDRRKGVIRPPGEGYDGLAGEAL